MTRHRILLLTLAFLPLSALAVCFNPPFAKAQSQDYLPPQQPEPPRSIFRPPHGPARIPRWLGLLHAAAATIPATGSPTARPRLQAPMPRLKTALRLPAKLGALRRHKARIHRMKSSTPDAASSAGASEGLAKVVEYSFQRNGRPKRLYPRRRGKRRYCRRLEVWRRNALHEGVPAAEGLLARAVARLRFRRERFEIVHTRVQSSIPIANLRALCGYRRFRLSRWRCGNSVSATRRCHSRAHSCRVRVAFGSQCRVSQIYALAYLEPFLRGPCRAIG